MLLVKYGNQSMRQMSIYLIPALERWDENLQIYWLNNGFPENVIDILMDPDFDSIDDDIYGADEESDKG